MSGIDSEIGRNMAALRHVVSDGERASIKKRLSFLAQAKQRLLKELGTYKDQLETERDFAEMSGIRGGYLT